MTKIKKIISLFLALIMLMSSGVFIGGVDAATAKPKVSAHAYVVIDANSGEVIISQNRNKRIYPASTTKLLTAIVAIENCSLSQKIKVKQSILDNIDEDTTVAGLKAGYTYTLEELLNMLLIYSAGDAADIIADAVAGSVEEFVDMMNKKAKEIGMNSSYFDNPVGMDWHKDPNIYSTASDIAKLTRYTMTNDTIRKIVVKPSYTIKNIEKGKSKTLYASNNFLRNQNYSKNLFKIIGSKTGTTDRAGYALTATAKDSTGREVICTFFGKSTRTQMFVDINKLLTYTFNNYKSKLEKSFYDIRYSSSKPIINKYLSNGVLSMTSSGKFGRTTKVSKKEFINTTNKILKSSYTTSSSENKITLLEVANLFKDFNSKTYSKSVKNKYKNLFGNLSSSNFNKMVHLYELNVLPKDYKYNINASISREEMILMLNKMYPKVKKFSKFTVNTIKSTSKSVSGYGEKGATIKVYVNGKKIGKTVTASSKNGYYKITIPRQKKGKKVTIKMSKPSFATKEKSVIVKN